jgi:hypothetical protein
VSCVGIAAAHIAVQIAGKANCFIHQTTMIQ